MHNMHKRFFFDNSQTLVTLRTFVHTKGWPVMAESEVARFLREIDEAYQAAQWALTGLACGMGRHDFINAKEERIAACHQELTTLIGCDEATALVAGVYLQGEQRSSVTSACEPVRER